MSEKLLYLAGHRAFERIRSHGLTPDDVKMVVGASGAAKWLILHGLDTALFSTWFAGRTEPLHLYGTSIGAWKSAAAAQKNPARGFDTLAKAYIHQFYTGKITRDQVAHGCNRILKEALQPGIPEEILSHPYCRLHFSAVRCRGALASNNAKMEMAGLIFGWGINRISRSLFAKICKPALFYTGTTPPPFIANGEFPAGHIPLTTDNFRQALLASGSIPYVMDGVRHIPGAPDGVYRDGGLYHYHPAFDFLAGKDGIVLYPHFYPGATLGWFDKNRPSRIADGSQLADVLLLSPSPKFIASLPLKRIPDRRDFERLAGRDNERVAFWEKTVERSKELGEEFLEVVDSGAICNLVKRIS